VITGDVYCLVNPCEDGGFEVWYYDESAAKAVVIACAQTERAAVLDAVFELRRQADRLEADAVLAARD